MGRSDPAAAMRSSLVIAVSGGSGSGKTTFARALQMELGADRCAILSQDSYYIDQSARFREDGGDEVNFDEPSAIDFALMGRQLAKLKLGHAIEVPVYDFATHQRLQRTERFEPHAIVIVDGTLVLSRDEIRPSLDASVFIDVPESVRFERRLERDTRERGRQPEGVRNQFLKQVKPMHDLYVQPSAVHATWVVADDPGAERCRAEIKAFADSLASGL